MVRVAKWLPLEVIAMTTILLLIAFELNWFQDDSTTTDIVKSKCLPGGLPDSTQKLRALYDNVEVFVMFIGYPRSSHSLVGSLLDAHPEVIIPHEYHIVENWQIYKEPKIRESGWLKYLLFYNLHSLSTWQAVFGNRAGKPVFLYDGIYSYHVPGSWQGTYQKKIKVIGDKKGGGTTMELQEKPEKFSVLKELNESLGIPLRFLHVVRNPYDIVSTWMLRYYNKRLTVNDGITKVNDSTMLNHFMKSFFDLVDTNEKIRQTYGETSVLDILSHEILSKPKEIMLKICAFLNITCNDSYLEQFGQILFRKPSKTRHSVIWTEQQKQYFKRKLQRYPYLETFEYNGEW